MTFQLVEVALGRSVRTEAAAHFLEVEQGNVGLLALPAHHDMLVVKATVLKTRTVKHAEHPAELGCQGLALRLP